MQKFTCIFENLKNQKVGIIMYWQLPIEAKKPTQVVNELWIENIKPKIGYKTFTNYYEMIQWLNIPLYPSRLQRLLNFLLDKS